MAELYPDTEILATNVSGLISYLQNNNTTDWYTTTDNTSNNELHVGMQDPSAQLDGPQPVDVHVRETANGNDTPTLDINLLENGTQVATLTSVTVTSTVGETVSTSFDAANVSAGADVEIQLVGATTGGMPAGRDVPEYGYVTWDAAILQNVSTTTEQPRNVDTSSATLVADATFAGYSGTADVWFTWGEVGAGMPNTTPTYTISSSQEVTHDLTALAQATEYEYQAHIDHPDTVADSGSIVPYWTHYPVAGTVTASDGTAVENATVLVTDVANADPVAELVTDVNGAYSTTVPGNIETHVAVEHDDGTTQYHAESYPFIP